jgi:uncharacterized membrane protein (DUF4010 family)
VLVDLYRLFPPEGAKILLVVFLSFLTGLEREEHKAGSEQYSFGGVRTYPLIGLIAYAVAFLSGGEILPVILGFAVVGGFLMLSYWHKVRSSNVAGFTSEMAALTTYITAVLVSREQFWIATTITVSSMLLLEFKVRLEGLTQHIAPEEILAFTKFLLLTAVILPVVPNRDFGPFAINPAKAWLVVVAVSTVSYGSYVLQKVTKGQGGVLFAALLGGAYSSTVATLVLARRAKREDRPHVFAGATLIACGMMYVRLSVLVAIFNRNLIAALGVPFALLASGALLAGWMWTRLPDARTGEVAREYEPQNPLELRPALYFAALFIFMLIATHFVAAHLGQAGVYALAAIMGVTDVDPFIMGMTQAGGTTTSYVVADCAILIAASSNNLVKGIYAYSIADRKTGRQSLMLLAALALAGLIPLLWLL